MAPETDEAHRSQYGFTSKLVKHKDGGGYLCDGGPVPHAGR
jgi:hypothetical protein